MAFSYDTQKASILIVKDGCDLCQQVINTGRDAITDGKLVVYRVFQSRIKGMWEIRALGAEIKGLPTLFSQDQIKEVPILYDPILDDMVIGAEDIEEYFEDTGII